jgi:hypothetical protein
VNLDTLNAMRIAAIEAEYWSSSAGDPGIAFGGMGAAANIVAALFQEKTPEQYRKEMESRKANDKKGSEPCQQ